jgi:hypothetical protein
MDALSAGIITIFNGIHAAFNHVLSPIALTICILGATMAWLAAVDVEELNRRGTKPRVGRH